MRLRIAVVMLGLLQAAFGWELWRAPAPEAPWVGAPRAAAAIADLNGDGTRDLVVGCTDSAVRFLSGANGSVLGTFSVTVPVWGEGVVWSLTTVPDLDGDGKEEVVAGTSGNTVFVIGGSGPEYWRVSTTATPLIPIEGDVWCVRAAGDVTGDGFPEIVCGAGDNVVRLLDIKGKRLLWSQDVGGDVWDVAGGRDLSGDDVPDVVAGTGANTIVAFNGVNGTQLWSVPTTADVWRVVVADDVNGDGTADIVAGTAIDHVICISGKPGGGGGPGGGGRQLWPPQLAVDVHVIVVAPDYTGDGIREILVGGNDDVVRLYNGASGMELWTFTAGGSVLDGLVGPDIDKDGRADLIVCTEGSAVTALGAAAGTNLWTYEAELPTAFRALAPLPDLDADTLPECAAVCDLKYVLALPAIPVLPPDSVTDFACVAAQVLGGPGTRLTWTDPAEAATIRLSEVTESGPVVLGEVPVGTGTLDVVAAGPAALREYVAVAIGPKGQSQSEFCTVLLTPPPVPEVTCGADTAGNATAAWVLPDPGLRVMDGVKVSRDDVPYATLPAGATNTVLGVLTPGSHTVTVLLVWELWESPPFTCTLWVTDPSADVPFRRGDGNGDGKCDISDAIKTLQYLFSAGEAKCLEALNTNGDGAIDISDAVYLLAYLFAHGKNPAEPFLTCGAVPGALCDVYPPTSCP